MIRELLVNHIRELGLLAAFSFGLCGAPLLAAEDCDIPGAAQKSLPMKDEKECEKACGSYPDCQSWVHVSGWNRCLLKDKKRDPRTIRMHAALKGGAVQVGYDHSGKDFKSIAHVPNAAECLAKCDAREDCLAMAYVEGYGDCYLKNTKGAMRPKVFRCGQRPQGESEQPTK